MDSSFLKENRRKSLTGSGGVEVVRLDTPRKERILVAKFIVQSVEIVGVRLRVVCSRKQTDSTPAT